jgi:hypothetical protein
MTAVARLVAAIVLVGVAAQLGCPSVIDPMYNPWPFCHEYVKSISLVALVRLLVGS